MSEGLSLRKGAISAPAMTPAARRDIRRERGVLTALPAGPAKKDLMEGIAKLASSGPVRFIAIGSGAILESVISGPLKVRYTVLPPPKGTLATISNADKSFEAHVFLDRLSEAQVVKGKAKSGGDHSTYSVRLLAGEPKTLVMSALLHGTPEPSLEAVAAWEGLKMGLGFGEDGVAALSD